MRANARVRRGRLLVAHPRVDGGLDAERHSPAVGHPRHELDRRDRRPCERHQATGRDVHRRPAGRSPSDGAGQDPGLQVEGALVCLDGPGREVQRLVADEELDALAVGDVEQHLVVEREAEGGLAVRDRLLLVEAVHVRPVHDVARRLVEVAAHAEVAVGQREDRLVARGLRRVELQLADPPWIDGIERSIREHRSRAPW